MAKRMCMSVGFVYMSAHQGVLPITPGLERARNTATVVARSRPSMQWPCAVLSVRVVGTPAAGETVTETRVTARHAPLEGRQREAISFASPVPSLTGALTRAGHGRLAALLGMAVAGHMSGASRSGVCHAAEDASDRAPRPNGLQRGLTDIQPT